MHFFTQGTQEYFSYKSQDLTFKDKTRALYHYIANHFISTYFLKIIFITIGEIKKEEEKVPFRVRNKKALISHPS